MLVSVPVKSTANCCLATCAWRSGFQGEPVLKVDKVLDPPFLEDRLRARRCSTSSSGTPPREAQLQLSKEEPRSGGHRPCLRSQSRLPERRAWTASPGQPPASLILSQMRCHCSAQSLRKRKSQCVLNTLTAPGTVHYVISNSCDSSFKMKVFIPTHKMLSSKSLVKVTQLGSDESKFEFRWSARYGGRGKEYASSQQDLSPCLL